jgi:hypothetical protein
LGQFQLKNLAEDVARQDVCLLDTRQVAGGDFEEKICSFGDQPAPLASESYSDRSDPPGSLKSQKYVPAVSGRGDSDHNISLMSKGFHLALEDVLVAIVVARSGKDRGIGGKRNRWDAGAVVTEANHELPIQVLCVCRASAVTAPEDLAAHADSQDHLGSDLVENALLVVEGRDDLEMIGKSCFEDFGPVGVKFCHVLLFLTKMSSGIDRPLCASQHISAVPR